MEGHLQNKKNDVHPQNANERDDTVAAAIRPAGEAEGQALVKRDELDSRRNDVPGRKKQRGADSIGCRELLLLH